MNTQFAASFASLRFSGAGCQKPANPNHAETQKKAQTQQQAPQAPQGQAVNG